MYATTTRRHGLSRNLPNLQLNSPYSWGQFHVLLINCEFIFTMTCPIPQRCVANYVPFFLALCHFLLKKTLLLSLQTFTHKTHKKIVPTARRPSIVRRPKNLSGPLSFGVPGAALCGSGSKILYDAFRDTVLTCHSAKSI